MLDVLVICLFGVLLARLQSGTAPASSEDHIVGGSRLRRQTGGRSGRARGRGRRVGPHPDPSLAAVEVPADLWAAFESVVPTTPPPIGVDGSAGHRRTTVGGMRPGDVGFVAATAALRNAEGALWLDAAAVVHPTPRPGRVALVRDEDGYRLQRPTSVILATDAPMRTKVPVLAVFD